MFLIVNQNIDLEWVQELKPWFGGLADIDMDAPGKFFRENQKPKRTT